MPRLPKDKCIDLIVKTSANKISKPEAKEIIDQLSEFLDNKKKAAGNVNMADELRQEAMRIIEKKKKDAAETYARSVMDQKTRADRAAEIAAFKDRPGWGFLASLVGISKRRITDWKQIFKGGAERIANSLNSVDYNRKVLWTESMRRMFSKIDAVGGRGILASHKFDLQIMQELAIAGSDKRPPVTGEMKTVRAIADAIHDMQGETLALAQRNGVFVDHLPGYMVQQVHNVERMKAVGKEAWIADQKQWLDERTYKGADPDKFLSSAWDAITTGIRLDGSAPAWGGNGGNLAKKMGEARVFHYKGPAEAYEHLRKYGHGSVIDAVAKSQQHWSNAIALIQKWGTNPERNFNELRQAMIHTAETRGDPKALKTLRDWKLDHALKIIQGMPMGDPTLAKIGSGARIWQMFAKLGFAVKYGISVDPATGWLQMGMEGKPFIQAAYSTIQSRLKAIAGAGDHKEVAKRMLSQAEGQLQASNKLVPGEDFNGASSKWAMTFFKATGMHPLDMMNRGGHEGQFTNFLGDNAKMKWADLPERTRGRATEFGIDEADWNLLRKAVYESSTGNRYMDVAAIREKISRNDISGPMEQAWKSERLKSETDSVLSALSKEKDTTEKVRVLWENSQLYAEQEAARKSWFEQTKNGIRNVAGEQEISAKAVNDEASRLWLESDVRSKHAMEREAWKKGVKDKFASGKLSEKSVRESIREKVDKAWESAKTGIEDRRYDQLESRLGTWIVDSVDRSIFRAGAAEQVILGRGLAPAGTIFGEAIRTGGQFKSYPVAAWRKGLLPHFYDSGLMGVARFIATTTMLGYATIALEDIVRGTNPADRDFNDPKLAMEAAAKGGGLGIYGDFLFGQSEIWEGIAGPTFAPGLNFATALRDSAQEGDPKKVKDVLIRDVRSNIPFQNFWATKSVLDYMIAYQMQEYINPGFLQRMEQRRRDRGQPEFFVPPSQVIGYGAQGMYPGEGGVNAAQRAAEKVAGQ